MKRHGQLWHRIIAIENLHMAHTTAKQGKSHYYGVRQVEKDIDGCIAEIHNQLVNKSFRTAEYAVEDRIEGGKLRRIYKLPYYPDRIVHHALMAITGPIIRSTLIRDTFQSLPHRGTSDARARVQAAIDKNKPAYALKMDIRKYYPSIDNDRLKNLLRTKIKCNDTLWLFDDIVDSMPGLPIGSLTSQYLGNFYLYQFDWWVKQKVQAKMYFRYCDDLIVLGNNKKRLGLIQKLIAQELDDIGLEIKPTWQICDLEKQGVDFVGYVFKLGGTRLRKSIACRFRSRVKSIGKQSSDVELIAKALVAYKGWVKHCDAKQLWRKHVTPAVIRRCDKVFKGNPLKGAV
jgi:RNA-directed DNA polymerase